MAYKPKDKVTVTCALPSCGAQFETARDKQRFCKEACRLEFVNSVRMNVCPNCGLELIR